MFPLQVLLLDPRHGVRAGPPPGQGHGMLRGPVPHRERGGRARHGLLPLAALPTHLLLRVRQDAALPVETPPGGRHAEEYHGQRRGRDHCPQLHQVPTKIRTLSFLLRILRVPQPSHGRPLNVHHRRSPPQQVLRLRSGSLPLHLGREVHQPDQRKIHHPRPHVRALPH